MGIGIINFHSLSPKSTSYNRAEQRRVRQAAQRNFGQGYLVMHPLSLDNFIARLETGGMKDPLKYRTFQRRLAECFSTTTMPIFIFADSSLRVEVEAWLDRVAVSTPITAPLVMVETEEGNPLPIFAGQEKDEIAWRLFAKCLRKDLGLRTLLIAGEEAIIDDDYKAKGCVYGARDGLYQFLGVAIAPMLTFPHYATELRFRRSRR
ncbi:hypothetical protein ACFL5U_00730 [Candidatus Margulisiibacteriota bacterium]